MLSWILKEGLETLRCGRTFISGKNGQRQPDDEGCPGPGRRLGKCSSELLGESGYEPRSHARFAAGRIHADAVVLDGKGDLAITPLEAQRDAARAFWKRVFDRIGRKLVDHQAERNSMIGHDRERFRIDSDLDAGIRAKKA